MRLRRLFIVLICSIFLATTVAVLYNEGYFMQNKIHYNVNKTYQTIEEGFGVSGCWWAPDVGGWTANTESGEDIREAIARYLFDKESGLGLSVYRYNVGAAVTPDKGKYSHYWRTVESPIDEHGNYNEDRDANGKYMLNLALKYGAEEVVLFANSPPNNLTKNGKAHSSDGKCNIDESNYRAYAEYFCDVAERFISDGIPVVALSPINEPEWEWKGGQEGCHYEPNEAVKLYETFIIEMEKRAILKDVELSIYESGMVGGRIYEYVDAFMSSDLIRTRFTKLDSHSYWASAEEKSTFYRYIEERYPELDVSMTEWCQMQNGRESGMNPAYAIANVIMDDLVNLNAIGWQYWLAVSCYHYEDGLLYVSVEDKNDLQIPLRYYAFSQFTKHIEKGAVRIASNVELQNRNDDTLRNCSFVNPNGDLVSVFINTGESVELFSIGLSNEYSYYETYSTNAVGDCGTKVGAETINSRINIPGQSITTIVYKK